MREREREREMHSHVHTHTHRYTHRYTHTHTGANTFCIYTDNWSKLNGGNGKVLPKQCESVTYEPIIDGDGTTLISDLFFFPSLHILLGITNKLVQELEKRWPDFHIWPESLHLVREDYFGKTYEVSIILILVIDHLTNNFLHLKIHSFILNEILSPRRLT